MKKLILFLLLGFSSSLFAQNLCGESYTSEIYNNNQLKSNQKFVMENGKIDY